MRKKASRGRGTEASRQSQEKRRRKSHPQITQIRADYLRGILRGKAKRRSDCCFLFVVVVCAFHPSPCPLPSEGRGFQRKRENNCPLRDLMVGCEFWGWEKLVCWLPIMVYGSVPGLGWVIFVYL